MIWGGSSLFSKGRGRIAAGGSIGITEGGSIILLKLLSKGWSAASYIIEGFLFTVGSYKIGFANWGGWIISEICGAFFIPKISR